MITGACKLYYSGIKELSHLTITLNEIDILGKLDILGWTKWCINAGHNNKSPDLGKTLCSGSTCLSPFIEFMLACGLGSKKLIDAGLVAYVDDNRFAQGLKERVINSVSLEIPQTQQKPKAP